MSDQNPRERHQALRNASGLHQFAGKDEEWNCEQ